MRKIQANLLSKLVQLLAKTSYSTCKIACLPNYSHSANCIIKIRKSTWFHLLFDIYHVQAKCFLGTCCIKSTSKIKLLRMLFVQSSDHAHLIFKTVPPLLKLEKYRCFISVHNLVKFLLLRIHIFPYVCFPSLQLVAFLVYFHLGLKTGFPLP